MYDVMSDATDVTAFALLTTVYLASARREADLRISSQCYGAARACLEAHLRVLQTTQVRNDVFARYYIPCHLLYAALSPIIVVFVHAIVHADREDIQLLHQFEDSLTSLELAQGDRLQGECERIVRSCAAFRGIAESRLASGMSADKGDNAIDYTSVGYETLGNLNAGLGFGRGGEDADLAALAGHAAGEPQSLLDISAFFNEWISDPQMIANFLGSSLDGV